MALLKILRYPDERLHRVAAKVPEVTDEIRTLVHNMAETMYAGRLEPRQVIVHDECHNLESELSKFIEVTFSLPTPPSNAWYPVPCTS